MTSELKLAGTRLWRLENKKRISEYSKMYSKKNRVQLLKKAFDRRSRNRELYRTRNVDYRTRTAPERLAYRKKNKQRINAWFRAWYKKNAEKMRLRSKEYRKQNPEKTRLAFNAYRARRKAAKIGSLKPISFWEKTWRGKPKATCYWCRRTYQTSECHSDHIIALALGGSHSVENLCISCGTCNARKSAASIHDWNQRIENPVLNL